MSWKTTSQNINYKPSGYLWGTLHPDMVALAELAQIQGNWLNLAAGDGRYNELLIDKCDTVTAFDLDQNALDRLVEHIPTEKRAKIQLKTGNLTTRLPFDDNEFDGGICTGTLHLFDETTLRGIFKEIFRIMKPQARFIMDFAVDIKRVLSDGSLHRIEGETPYSSEEGKRILGDIFRAMSYDLKEGEVPDFPVENFDIKYTFSCGVLSLSVVVTK